MKVFKNLFGDESKIDAGEIWHKGETVADLLNEIYVVSSVWLDGNGEVTIPVTKNASVYLIVTGHNGTVDRLRSAHLVFTSTAGYTGSSHAIKEGSAITVTPSSGQIKIANSSSGGCAYSVIKLV